MDIGQTTRSDDLRSWVIWAWLMPISVACLMWLIAHLVGIKQAGWRVFGGGDLLAVAALIAVQCGADSVRDREDRRSTWAELCLLFGTLCFLLYGAQKTWFLYQSLPSGYIATETLALLKGWTKMSVAIAASVAGFALLIRLHYQKSKLEQGEDNA